MDTAPHCPRCGWDASQQGAGPRFCPKCRFPLARLAGKYALVAELQEGPFGAVYEAHHLGLPHHSRRAVKMIKPELFEQPGMQERFHRELQVASLLSQFNPHVVRIYDDFGEYPGLGHFYVMEFLEGQDLAQRLQSFGGALPLSESYHIFSQLCDAMKATHGEGIIHRDLKPQNLFLVDHGPQKLFLKVLDFGIAKPLNWTVSVTGELVGSPRYMSPEQCLGRAVDGRSDIYAMGIVLYELLTGRTPFGQAGAADDSRSSMNLLQAHVHMAPPPLSSATARELPAGLEAVVQEALQKRPEHRFATVEALEAAFHQALQPALERGRQRRGQLSRELPQDGAIVLALRQSQLSSHPTSCPPGAQCPDENDLVAMLQGFLDDQELQSLEAVIDRCATCSQTLVELAQLLHSGSQEPEASEAAPPGRATLLDAHEAPREAPATRQIGRYQIVRQCGLGGMGVVYEAFDPELHRRIALKVMRPDVALSFKQEQYTARMMREARLLASLDHPNILAIHDVGQWQHQLYLAVQFIDGQTLREWVKGERPGWLDIARAYLDAGAGLAAAHDAGIVHRDIKPDNVLLAHDGRVYLTDFGLARTVEAGLAGQSLSLQDPEAAPLTISGALLGTPAYMPPEQLNAQEATPESDQFSFCASMYESIYGFRPYYGDSIQSLLSAVLEGQLIQVSRDDDVPPALFDVLSRGLQAMPEQRYPSIRHLLDALHDAIGRGPNSQASEAASSAAKPGLHPLLYGLAALLLVAFGAGGVWLATRPDRGHRAQPAKALAPKPPPRKRPTLRKKPAFGPLRRAPGCPSSRHYWVHLRFAPKQRAFLRFRQGKGVQAPLPGGACVGVTTPKTLLLLENKHARYVPCTTRVWGLPTRVSISMLQEKQVDLEPPLHYCIKKK